MDAMFTFNKNKLAVWIRLYKYCILTILYLIFTYMLFWEQMCMCQRSWERRQEVNSEFIFFRNDRLSSITLQKPTQIYLMDLSRLSNALYIIYGPSI